MTDTVTDWLSHSACCWLGDGSVAEGAVVEGEQGAGVARECVEEEGPLVVPVPIDGGVADSGLLGEGGVGDALGTSFGEELGGQRATSPFAGPAEPSPARCPRDPTRAPPAPAAEPQTSPRIADGAAGLRDYLTAQNKAHPDARVSIKRVIGEGDLIAVHSNLILEPGTRGYSVLDLYRVDGRKIVEHWDTTQEVPATTASGNDMFSTLSQPQVSRPAPYAPTALNKQLVTDMYKQVFVGKDVTAFDRYIVDPYYQHNPGGANGIKAAKDGIAGMFAAFPDFHSDIFRVVAEGDLVVIQSRGTAMPGVAAGVFDIYRVQHGKVVEHWDIVQNVPSTSANDNSMF